MRKGRRLDFHVPVVHVTGLFAAEELNCCHCYSYNSGWTVDQCVVIITSLPGLHAAATTAPVRVALAKQSSLNEKRQPRM